MRRAIVIVGLVLLAGNARADEDQRPFHGSLGVGGSLLATGARGDSARLDAIVDLKPRSRFGGLLAWRAFDEDHRGLVTAGLVYEAGAARPRLVLDLHADVGVDLDNKAPLAGGGLRTSIAILGPVGIALDTGALLVVDGLDDTRLQIYTAALLIGRF
jgi:hypothetical protein